MNYRIYFSTLLQTSNMSVNVTGCVIPTELLTFLTQVSHEALHFPSDWSFLWFYHLMNQALMSA